jgi:hypothetical protein
MPARCEGVASSRGITTLHRNPRQEPLCAGSHFPHTNPHGEEDCLRPVAVPAFCDRHHLPRGARADGELPLAAPRHGSGAAESGEAEGYCSGSIDTPRSSRVKRPSPQPASPHACRFVRPLAKCSMPPRTRSISRQLCSGPGPDSTGSAGRVDRGYRRETETLSEYEAALTRLPRNAST